MDIFHDRLNTLYEECLDRDPGCGRRGFARLCKVSFYKVDNYLSGKGMPTIDTLRIFSSSLNVNPLWLMGLREERHEDKYILQKMIRELNQDQVNEMLSFVNYLKFKDQFDEFVLYKNKQDM